MASSQPPPDPGAIDRPDPASPEGVAPAPSDGAGDAVEPGNAPDERPTIAPSSAADPDADEATDPDERPTLPPTPAADDIADDERATLARGQPAPTRTPRPSVVERLMADLDVDADGATMAWSGVTLPGREPGTDPGLAPPQHDGLNEHDKYDFLGLLGEGGVGVVMKGHDRDIQRDVAVKFLRDRFREDVEMTQRFVEEAQIGGQLQHPGIVPVYDLAYYEGRPFFTMKLIKGDTLAQQLHVRKDVADDRRRFLQIFEQICHTMAYAHTRGVIHRDLKPDNVMIGAFGEVQVVDWGMGKVLEPRDEDDDEEDEIELIQGDFDDVTVIETERSRNKTTRSVSGSVMGTPSYMPPEQARGDIELVDERADVFALGAILMEILTGDPPYVDTRIKDLLRRARRCDLRGAREKLNACGAEQELVDLALECMAPSRRARPQDAGDLQKRISAYLAKAEERAYEATLKAETAKRTQRMLAAVVLTILVGLVVSLVMMKRAFDAEAKAKRNLDNFNHLSLVVRLENMREQEETLYPAWPETVAAMTNWLVEADDIIDARAVISATIELLGTREAGVGRTRAEAEADQFLREELTAAISDIDKFEKLIGKVRERRAWAEEIKAISITRYENSLWKTAREAIAKADGDSAAEAYAQAKFDLEPQMGLVPIGMNPVTRLWEFYHLRSAWDPKDGIARSEIRIPSYAQTRVIDPETYPGIVFVLIPGGTFLMGSQNADSNAPNYYEKGFVKDGKPWEGKVHEVTLGPFLLAKHELTRLQYMRLTGEEDPSQQHIGDAITVGRRQIRVSEYQPVDNISWLECDTWTRRFGLLIPTESQWEYACRAGSSTHWYGTDDHRSLTDIAHFTRNEKNREKMTRPVGRFDPNAFGLHDMHGNLIEWVRDRFNYPYTAPRAGDGFRDTSAFGEHVARGGSYYHLANEARSSIRYAWMPDVKNRVAGLRPSRALLPR